jgi:hypothetical protein
MEFQLRQQDFRETCPSRHAHLPRPPALQNLVVAIGKEGGILSVQHRRQEVKRSVAEMEKARDMILEGDRTFQLCPVAR